MAGRLRAVILIARENAAVGIQRMPSDGIVGTAVGWD
jgi:hypothetical protein